MNNLTEAQIKSIEAKLQKLAASEGRTGMQARTLFLLERAVARMVLDSELQRCLVFKGGFVSLRVYGSQRFTTDVDATLRGISAEDATRRILEAMKVNLGDGAWFHFESKEETSAQNEYGGLSLKFRSGLGTPPRKIEDALRIGIDLGIGDSITPAALHIRTSLSVGEGQISWHVYPIESMIAEKLHALLFLAHRNSRSKDIFDMNMFWEKANPDALRKAIEETFRNRSFPVPEDIARAVSEIDTTILKKGWVSATASIKPTLKFETVYASLLEKLSTIH